MHITMVKKVLADGSPCRKCGEVEAKLRAEGLLQRIDRTVVADERDPESEGMKLARQHGVELAPFFVIEDGQGNIRVYTIFLRFLREVLRREGSPEDEAKEILERGPNLDFL